MAMHDLVSKLVETCFVPDILILVRNWLLSTPHDPKQEDHLPWMNQSLPAIKANKL